MTRAAGGVIASGMRSETTNGQRPSASVVRFTRTAGTFDAIIPDRGALIVGDCACGNRIEMTRTLEGMPGAWSLQQTCGCGVTWHVRGYGPSVTHVDWEGESRPRPANPADDDTYLQEVRAEERRYEDTVGYERGVFRSADGTVLSCPRCKDRLHYSAGQLDCLSCGTAYLLQPE